MTEIENRDNQQDMSSTDQQGSRGHTFGEDEMDSAIIIILPHLLVWKPIGACAD